MRKRKVIVVFFESIWCGCVGVGSYVDIWRGWYELVLGYGWCSLIVYVVFWGMYVLYYFLCVLVVYVFYDIFWGLWNLNFEGYLNRVIIDLDE